MKKIIILTFAMFASTLASHALTAQETSTPQYIINHGYSDEMARLIDLQNAQVNGTEPQYKIDEDWTHLKYPKCLAPTSKATHYIRNFFIYIDPAADDGSFAQKNTRFTNSWDDL